MVEQIEFKDIKLTLYNDLPAVHYLGEWYYWKINKLGGEYLERADGINKGKIKYTIKFHRFV